jgi:hypothetical protein
LPAQPRAIAIRTGKILDVKTGTYLLQQMILDRRGANQTNRAGQ